MTFYLKPPHGTTDLRKLQFGVEKRFRFLCSLSSCTSETEVEHLAKSYYATKHSEYLIDGSALDRMSHYILRVLICDDSELNNLVINAETKLFKLRYKNQSKRERKVLLNTVSRHVNYILSNNSCKPESQSFLKDLEAVSHQLLIGAEFIKISFQYVIELVRCREVKLENGIAIVSYGNEVDLISELFHYSLNQAQWYFQNLAHSPIMKEDKRFEQIGNALKAEFYNTSLDHTTPPKSLICVEDEFDRFPLCMMHLHSVLRRKHRLTHEARVQYTLFLKDAGLSVSDAIRFWKNEYTKVGYTSVAERTVCPDKWNRRSNRYEYGIRHLYGLEGSCRNYQSHCCKTLQTSMCNANSEGGCPFACFDHNYLQDYLLSLGLEVNVVKKLMKFCKFECYQEACTMFMLARLDNRVSSCPKQSRNCGTTDPCQNFILYGKAIDSSPDFQGKIHNSSCFLQTHHTNFSHLKANSADETNCSLKPCTSVLDKPITASQYDEHVCFPNKSSSGAIIESRQYKPSLIYSSFKKLLDDLKSVA